MQDLLCRLLPYRQSGPYGYNKVRLNWHCKDQSLLFARQHCFHCPRDIYYRHFGFKGSDADLDNDSLEMYCDVS
jgi:hypothetical protein